ncbi:transposase [Singulisphaera sp. PoT]
MARRRPRSPDRTEARAPAPRRRPRPRPTHRHRLDPRRRPRRRVPLLLHRRGRRRQGGRSHRRTPAHRGGQAAAPGSTRLVLALDDTPTKRHGPHVQGAGVHHNPTPGPAGSPYVYGHVFVVLGLLATHPARGVVALPLLSRLYVRKADLPAIDPRHRPEFRTKLQMAVELLRWAQSWLDLLGLPIWVVADGAYAKRGSSSRRSPWV